MIIEGDGVDAGDRQVHQPILGAVNFTNTPAVIAAIRRGLKMGLDSEAIKTVLGVTDQMIQSAQQEQ